MYTGVLPPYMKVCRCVPGALRHQKRTSNLLELELQMAVNHCVVGNQTEVLLLTSDPSPQPLLYHSYVFLEFLGFRHLLKRWSVPLFVRKY